LLLVWYQEINDARLANETAAFALQQASQAKDQAHARLTNAMKNYVTLLDTVDREGPSSRADERPVASSSAVPKGKGKGKARVIDVDADEDAKMDDDDDDDDDDGEDGEGEEVEEEEEEEDYAMNVN
jgi:hypothetical protein